MILIVVDYFGAPSLPSSEVLQKGGGIDPVTPRSGMTPCAFELVVHKNNHLGHRVLCFPVHLGSFILEWAPSPFPIPLRTHKDLERHLLAPFREPWAVSWARVCRPLCRF